MNYTPTFCTCRVCGAFADSTSLIHYAVRHYAHPACGLRKWGAGFFDRLHPWQLRNFPYFVAVDHGLGDELVRRVERVPA